MKCNLCEKLFIGECKRLIPHGMLFTQFIEVHRKICSTDGFKTRPLIDCTFLSELARKKLKNNMIYLQHKWNPKSHLNKTLRIIINEEAC
jgi:hypothetical protein